MLNMYLVSRHYLGNFCVFVYYYKGLQSYLVSRDLPVESLGWVGVGSRFLALLQPPAKSCLSIIIRIFQVPLQTAFPMQLPPALFTTACPLPPPNP